MIRIENVSKWYGDFQVLKNCSTSVKKGEVVVICGPSGSGKSTLIKTVNGLEDFQEGTIYVNNINIGDPHTNLPKLRAHVGMVFQHFELFPHLTIRDNLTLAQMKVLKRSRDQANKRGMELLDRVGLIKHADKFPPQLSGGQQQRVAIARGLVNHPRVLLLDEPLGALDLKLRKEMQLELKRLQQAMNITFIYVTHDQEEALTMSDTVVVMKDGNIQQIGSPIDIYNEPENAFVASFIGESNIIDGIMLKDFCVEFAGNEFTCVDKGFGHNELVQVVIRPEDIQVVPAIQGQLTGVVKEVIFKGVHYEMRVEQAGYEWIIHSTQASAPGELIGMCIGPDEIHIMTRTEG